MTDNRLIRSRRILPRDPRGWDFARQLETWGPHASYQSVPVGAAERYTRKLATRHYENFPVLTPLLPRRLHQHFANVYAYSRWSDDLSDETCDHETALQLLDWWEAELDALYAGKPHHPVMVALQKTVQRFAIPAQPFRDLLAAFRRDQRQTRYATFAELLDYCRYSANPVGRIVLYMVEASNEENCRLSDSICSGLQLANFWQDVAEDASRGRIYIPQDDLANFGVAEADLKERRYSDPFKRLMAFEVERADALLREGLPLVEKMSGRIRFVIAMFAFGGLEILEKIRRQDYNVLERRPKLGKKDVMHVVWKAMRYAL